MTDENHKKRRLSVAEEAARWLVLLESTGISTEGRAKFIDWLRESPVHVAEMLHVGRLHRDLTTFNKWKDIATLAQESPGELVEIFPNISLENSPALRRTTRFRPVIFAAAALVIVAVISTMLIFALRQTTLRTQSGERRAVTLVDGSVVELAPSSEVQVRFHPDSRNVTLKGGQALFHVAKNATRPFVVEVGSTRVRAVGTAFSVERDRLGVSVTVIEGKVTVSDIPKSASAPTVVSLESNEQAVVSALNGAISVRQVKAETVIAWAKGEFIFDDESIADVAARFNRYNRLKIRVVDPKLAARKVSGIFSAYDPQSFAAFISSEVDPRVQQDSNVILLGAPSKQP